MKNRFKKRIVYNDDGTIKRCLRSRASLGYWGILWNYYGWWNDIKKDWYKAFYGALIEPFLNIFYLIYVVSLTPIAPFIKAWKDYKLARDFCIKEDAKFYVKRDAEEIKDFLNVIENHNYKGTIARYRGSTRLGLVRNGNLILVREEDLEVSADVSPDDIRWRVKHRTIELPQSQEEIDSGNHGASITGYCCVGVPTSNFHEIEII